MASGVRRLRFSQKRSGRKPLFILIVAVLLGIIGWFGWPLVRPAPDFGLTPSTRPEGQETPGALPEPDQAGPDPVPLDPALVESAGDSSVRRILENVMASWVAALVKEDFSQFHQTLYSAWRQKDDPARLKASYGVLAPFRENLKLFPSRGKLVLLESRPFTAEGLDVAEGSPSIRDNIGPETPWLVRGEWRVNKTALGFTLVLNLEDGQWRPSGLKVEIF
ncbi:MAG: hypothetical protein LBL95_05570 [Deltaproteobacteria bacterium]|jgi:hypothetical protein|nr:hypothetical protein [Deltaproteobacteria bacterium]